MVKFKITCHTKGLKLKRSSNYTKLDFLMIAMFCIVDRNVF